MLPLDYANPIYYLKIRCEGDVCKDRHTFCPIFCSTNCNTYFNILSFATSANNSNEHLNRNNSNNKSDVIIEHKQPNDHILLWRW